MNPNSELSPPEPAIAPDLENELSLSLRSLGVSVTLIQCGNEVILEGVARNFYGKQMAQELARKAKLVVISNRIRVERALA